MLNKRPIVLNCFSRGGSNILWNVFLSHPEVCSPIRETLELFRLDRKGIRGPGIKSAIMTRQLYFFNQWNLKVRNPISDKAMSYIDKVLYGWKLKTLQDNEMRFKFKDVLYDQSEVEQARLVLKNNNGTIFLSDIVADIYPDVIFFGLLREPVSLYESHKRRRTPVGVSPQKFAEYYRKMIQKMLDDASRWDFYHIVRFEGLLMNPLPTIEKLYNQAGLDIEKIKKMRFKAKPHMQADGSHATPYIEGRHYWFNLDEIPRMFEPQVNGFQVSRLRAEEAELIKSLTHETRLIVGYTE
jgi:hypothetical protein